MWKKSKSVDAAHPQSTANQPLTTSRSANIEILESHWSSCSDLKRISTRIYEHRVEIVYLSGTIDNGLLHESVMIPLEKMLQAKRPSLEDFQSSQPVQREKLIQQVNQLISNGNVAIFIDNFDHALCVDISKFPSRAIDVSQNEPTLQGPQDAFTENLGSSIAQIRNIVRTPSFKVHSQVVGTVSNTAVCVLYIDGVVNDSFVDEAKERLNKIDIHAILDSNYIAEMISDTKLSLFPTTEFSERPDKVAAGLLEGRIALLIAGSQVALLYPTTLFHLLHAGDDYYGSHFIALPLRVVRNFLFWLSMTLPSIYVATLAFQKDLIPTPLLLNLGKQHEGIPFNSAIEALLITLAFEIVREGGQRLPKTTGVSVSILAALVVGETSVSAGFITPGMVIVVAITGLATFVIPSYSLVNSVRIMQYFFLGTAAMFGFYGVMVLLLVVIVHLASLESFGVSYLSPVAPFSWKGMRDTFIRVPWSAHRRRPETALTRNHGRNRSKSRGR